MTAGEENRKAASKPDDGKSPDAHRGEAKKQVLPIGNSPRAARRPAGEGSGDRYYDIIQAAAILFAERGYLATSMRDIAERVGLLGGSLYHHVRSKEDLFVAVHAQALEMASEQIATAISQFDDPWQRLEAACVRQLEIQLDPDLVDIPFLTDFRNVPAEILERLIIKRDAFEAAYVKLVDSLPLPPHIDKSLYRLLLLSLINSVPAWYRPGRMTPAEIGRQIIHIFRHEHLAGTSAP